MRNLLIAFIAVVSFLAVTGEAQAATHHRARHHHARHHHPVHHVAHHPHH